MTHWTDRFLVLLWGAAFAVIVWVPIEENGPSPASIVAARLAR